MSIKETIPFNYDEIYKFIEEKFKNKGYDTEQGSNTMQLVTAMSYLTSMLNANTAVNINETLLPLARKRENVLQDARVLGYEIEHIRSYQYKLQITFDNPNNYTDIFRIKKYQEFYVGDKTYYYMGNEIEVEVDGLSTSTFDIIIIEGTLTKFENDTTLANVIESFETEDGEIKAQSYIDVPFTDVEENGLEVFLTYYDEFGQFYEQELWEKSNTFMIDKDTVLNKQYVRIDNIDLRTPRIYFKLGDVGKEVRVGTIVQVNVLQSSGPDGIFPQNTIASDIKHNIPNLTIDSYSLELEGSFEETLDSIKQNAPIFHNTANRVITKPDYIAFCNRLAKVQYTDVWDGHVEFPIRPGHIWFSFISSKIIRNHSSDEQNTVFTLDQPDNAENWYIDQKPETGLDPDINEIFNELDNYKVPTLVFKHRNPIFFDFTFDVNIVKYNAVKTKAERNKLVFDVIDQYFKGFDDEGNRVVETPVETFGYEYFQSNLNKRIDIELTDIMGFNIDTKYTITLSDKNIINDEIPSTYYADGETPSNYYNEIRFKLGFPYEKMITNRTLDIDKMPMIYSELSSTNQILSIDTNSLNQISDVYEFDIVLNPPESGDRQVIGKYIVRDGVVKEIEVVLNVKTINGHTDGLNLTDLQSNIILEVSYPSDNIRFVRNTIPRLKQVNFI